MTKVLVVDDQKIMRAGIMTLLRKYSDCEVVGQAADGQQAVDMAAALKPDVVILDVSMPKMSGTEAARRMTAVNPDLKILALSAYSEEKVIREMIDAGACGYLLKDSLFEELGEALEAFGEGQPFFSNAIADKIPSDLYDET